MINIEIDDALFAYLQEHARPFVDSPNSTLRRLLEMDPVANQEADLRRENNGRSKAPKADLALLVERGVIRNGQTLHLVNYKNKRVQDGTATVSGSGVIYKGDQYSLSGLAQQLLREQGYTSFYVRGPAHWVTEDHKSIKDLWDAHLAHNERQVA